LETVVGDLQDDAALRRLVRGADAVVHAAALIRATTDRDYFVTNSHGSARIGTAIRQCAPEARFVVISSLAAREPQLSAYAASKRAGEDAAVDSCGRAAIAILRPCAVYGPWDRETLRFFRAARRPVVVIPAAVGRISLVHAADLAEAVAAVTESRVLSGVFELTDDNWAGYSWREIATRVAAALGSAPRIIGIPHHVLRAAGPLLGAVRLAHANAMLTPGKLREILHDDWSSNPAAQLPPSLWRPRIGLASGCSQTARWYVENGWIGSAGRPG
jgi:nucleoside-diphosphate-sugar epimerase